MDERTFCCAACRLLQSAGTGCIECGVAIGEIEASSTLLHDRVPADVTGRKSGIRMAIAGVSIGTAASIVSPGRRAGAGDERRSRIPRRRPRRLMSH
jgi:hypothetical protein